MLSTGCARVLVATLLLLVWGCRFDEATGDGTRTIGPAATTPPAPSRTSARSNTQIADATALDEVLIADVSTLADKTVQVSWLYVRDSQMQWFIVRPLDGAVLRLEGVTENTVLWRPVHDYRAASSPGTSSFPDAKNALASVSVSADGHRVSFGARRPDEDPLGHAASIASTTLQVHWLYIYSVAANAWYIVGRNGPSVLRLHKVDSSVPGGILWKPVSDVDASANPATSRYASAGTNFEHVTINASGRAVVLGRSSLDHPRLSFEWPVDPTNGSVGYFAPGCRDGRDCYWLGAGGWRDVSPFQRYDESATSCEIFNPCYHLGADWNLSSGDRGKPIYAVSEGVVIDILPGKRQYGNIILLLHRSSEGEFVSMYAHVDWLPSGAPPIGSWVARRQQIACVGDGANGGKKYDPHLHFELRTHGNYEVIYAYTPAQLAASDEGPQRQVDPNAFIATRLASDRGRLPKPTEC